MFNWSSKHCTHKQTVIITETNGQLTRELFPFIVYVNQAYLFYGKCIIESFFDEDVIILISRSLKLYFNDVLQILVAIGVRFNLKKFLIFIIENACLRYNGCEKEAYVWREYVYPVLYVRQLLTFSTRLF